MELLLVTTDKDSVCTQGELSVDGTFECFTLELPVKDGLPGSAIPAGRFQVILAPSPDFLASSDPWVKQYAAYMPHIVDIPGRSLIMIHWGNVVANVRGCVAVGKTKAHDFQGESRLAFSALYLKIRDAAASGNCFIAVQR
jgi:hypothetical protein